MLTKEDLAHRFGYETFRELLDVSRPLPPMPGENHKSYLARNRNGRWFVWDDSPLSKSEPVDGESDW